MFFGRHFFFPVEPQNKGECQNGNISPAEPRIRCWGQTTSQVGQIIDSWPLDDLQIFFGKICRSSSCCRVGAVRSVSYDLE